MMVKIQLGSYSHETYYGLTEAHEDLPLLTKQSTLTTCANKERSWEQWKQMMKEYAQACSDYAVIHCTLSVYVLASILNNLCKPQNVILIGNKVPPDVAT